MLRDKTFHDGAFSCQLFVDPRHVPEEEKGVTGNTAGMLQPAVMLRVKEVLAREAVSLCQSPFFPAVMFFMTALVPVRPGAV
jgi:hypothetical protein